MKWDIPAVVKHFGLLAGLSEREAQSQRFLCEDAAAQIEGIAKSPLKEEEELLLHRTAAALAFYRWSLLEGVRGPESFAAGEIQVKKDADLQEKAKQIWMEYRAAASHCLLDQSFIFQRVKAIDYRYENGNRNGGLL